LQLYRGEPAISRFDYNFSSNHKSSEIISTSTGSALRLVLSSLQPAHEKLNLANNYNSPAHSAKSTPLGFMPFDFFSLSVTNEYLALRGGPRFHFLWHGFPTTSSINNLCNSECIFLQPQSTNMDWFGLCFNSPGSLLSIMKLRPYHITGYHVLHRLLVPSYPPYTLSNLYF
ncbi:15797_t:CDS:2, partial [Funneliformis geosporum]